MQEILRVEDLNYYYGANHALKGINISVEEGEIVALIGSNGAGKTTTLSCISGLLGKPARGTIMLYGKNITGKRTEEIVSYGLAHVLEGRHIFAKLTVRENLLMGAFNKSYPFSEGCKYVYQLFPRLKEREEQEAGTLSGGEQQMLAFARSLMSKPNIMLMDEPSLGLAPLIVKEIFETIKRINADGVTVLIVEQNSKAALNIARRGYVMVNGQIALFGDAERLIKNEDVRKQYLGED
jgi:branched-chain amino acid transport system ATP-binding protein